MSPHAWSSVLSLGGAILAGLFAVVLVVTGHRPQIAIVMAVAFVVYFVLTNVARPDR